jgi:hypothetical protein
MAAGFGTPVRNFCSLLAPILGLRGGAELKGVWGIYIEKSMGQIPMNSVQILWDLGPVSNTHKKDYPRH